MGERTRRSSNPISCEKTFLVVRWALAHGWGVEQHFASEFIMLIFLCGARRYLFGVKHELDGIAGDNNDIGEVLDDDHWNENLWDFSLSLIASELNLNEHKFEFTNAERESMHVWAANWMRITLDSAAGKL